ncbi:unannotated protein [freshwater metagenome]|uniref:Unannotated protein n=1 Tax=freshwater metagenome TaxID=449393 RepID=A0A6J6WJ65_9ZZZZ
MITGSRSSRGARSRLRSRLRSRPRACRSLRSKRSLRFPRSFPRSLLVCGTEESSPSSSESSLLLEGLLSFFRLLRASRRASRSAFAASRFFACKSAIASTSASFFIFAAPSTPSCVATVFNLGRVIAESSGLLERTGSISVVMCFFSILVNIVLDFDVEPWMFFKIYLMCCWPLHKRRSDGQRLAPNSA